MLCIFSAEFVSGRFLQKRGQCPWCYSRSGWNVRRLIRLDYAPAWFCIGLLFERVIMGGREKNGGEFRKRQAPSP